MKTLILADVHANLAALEAVLHKEGSWDDLLFLGDAVVAGPQPNEVLSLLSSLPGTYIMGNHDRELLNIDVSVPTVNPHRLWLYWDHRQLTAPNRRFLTTFRPAGRYSSQKAEFYCHHGDLPADLGRRLWPDSPEEVFAALAQRYPGRLILIAHSHVQFIHRHQDTWIVNPGSVGQQRLGLPEACYAVMEDGEIDLRSVPYDVEKTCASMEQVPLTDRHFVGDWQNAWRRGVLPARYHIRDFTPLLGKGYR